jgi:polyphosphate glucokinase
MQALGIDIGGTGIKGAVVDLDTGDFVGERLRIKTPHPATPDAVGYVVGKISRNFSWNGPVGITFPGVVKRGTIHTAANVDPFGSVSTPTRCSPPRRDATCGW